MRTLGFPPSFTFLASMSPNALETESLPGKIRNGPNIFSFLVKLASVL